jgi:hypothetical protein
MVLCMYVQLISTNQGRERINGFFPAECVIQGFVFFTSVSFVFSAFKRTAIGKNSIDSNGSGWYFSEQ